jgi:phosphoserine phosphatase RsbU/P
LSEVSQPRSGDEKRPRRIGLLGAFADDEYEWTIFRGAQKAAEERGASIVFFAGSRHEDPNIADRSRGFVFDLVDASNLDGLLCLSSIVGSFTSIPELEAWLARYGLPVVCIGPGETMPSVAIDGQIGVMQLMHHLIEHHQYRRIAFVTGPPTNAEANERLTAYKRSLDEHAIEFDPKLVLTGEFTRASGVQAVQELFEQRQIPVSGVDAIITANDYTAFGVIDELSRRRIGVPDQVAVVGFDDITPARLHDPPITTIRQPLHELGREGANRLLDRIEGRPLPSHHAVNTELVLRRSCGCVPTDIPSSPDSTSDETVSSGTGDGLTANLLSALAAEIRGNQGAFVRALDPLLRRLASGSARQLEHNRRLADQLAGRLRLAKEDLVSDRLHRLSRALQTRMFGPQVQLSAALAELLPSLDIDECAVSELEAGGSQTLKVAFGFDAHNHQPQLVGFPGKELVPPGFPHLRTQSLVVLPVKYNSQPLGIAVVPVTDHHGSVYETLAEVFGIVLKGLEVRRRADARA